MKHSGRATKAAFKLILISLIAVLAVYAIIGFSVAAAAIVTAVAVPSLLLVLPLAWIVFSLFTLYFFRDPNPRVPAGASLVGSPAHGKVDVIDTTTEPLFMGGECQRVSIFLSVIDIHVQNAPVTGKISFFKYSTGQFLNALKTASAVHNENVLLGFECSDPPRQKIAIRLIAGVLARRIVPFVQGGEEVARGERISLIQFGSRTDVYLPASAKIKVKLGDHVVGGETVIAAVD
jgi:phosphatidylserine decarboxylase